MKKINTVCIRRHKLWIRIKYPIYYRTMSIYKFSTYRWKDKYLVRLSHYYEKPIGWWKKQKFAIHCHCDYCRENVAGFKMKKADLDFKDMLEEVYDFSSYW